MIYLQQASAFIAGACSFSIKKLNIKISFFKSTCIYANEQSVIYLQSRKYYIGVIKQFFSCAGNYANLSLYQKLIDVQQTLIKNPNPLKSTVSQSRKNQKKSDISQLLFFKFQHLF